MSKTFTVKDNVYKKVKRMSKKELEFFLQQIYQQGFEDGSYDISGIPVGRFLNMISQAPGIGPANMKIISNAVKDVITEEGTWQECLKKEQELKRSRLPHRFE